LIKKVTSVGSKGLALATDYAAKGADFASNTIAKVNNYSPVDGTHDYKLDHYEESTEWDDWTQPKYKDHPQTTKIVDVKPEKQIENDWDAWEPRQSPKKPTSPVQNVTVQKNDTFADDEWDDF
jgi:hypothetical protein